MDRNRIVELRLVMYGMLGESSKMTLDLAPPDILSEYTISMPPNVGDHLNRIRSMHECLVSPI